MHLKASAEPPKAFACMPATLKTDHWQAIQRSRPFYKKSYMICSLPMVDSQTRVTTKDCFATKQDLTDDQSNSERLLKDHL